MAHALGSLCALAPGKSVRSLALRACKRFTDCFGSNDDPAVRRAAAAALRAMAVRASNQFADGGPGDIWCRKVLPVAYLGQKDQDEAMSKTWKEVWDDGGASANLSDGSDDEFGVLLEEKLLPYLVKSCVDGLNDVSWSRRKISCGALSDLADLELFAPVKAGVILKDGTASVSDADLIRTRRRAQSSNIALGATVKLIVKSRLWDGKSETVKAAVKIAKGWIPAALQVQDESSFGWINEEKEDSHCPWVPLFAKADVSDDLFLGDAWFTSKKEEIGETVLMMEENPDKNDKTNETGHEAENEASDGEPIEPDLEPTEEKGASHSWQVLNLYGMCRAFLDLALLSLESKSASVSEEVLPLKSAALSGLSQILLSVRNGQAAKEHSRLLYGILAPFLVNLFGSESGFQIEKATSDPQPVLVSRALDCLASGIWKDMGKDPQHDWEDVLKLSRAFVQMSGGKQPAWTVRESACLAGASLASFGALEPLRSPETISSLLECTNHSQKDRKFWRVRLAGLRLIKGLISRAGEVKGHGRTSLGGPLGINDTFDEKQLMLEALLPHKEAILKIARKSLSDPEAQVTAAASEICSSMSWWP